MFFRSFEGAGMAVIRSSCRFTLQSRPALLRSWWLWYDCEREACGSTGKSHSNSYLVAELLTIHLCMMSWHVLEWPSLIKSFSMFFSCFLCRCWSIICFDICFDQSLNTWVDIVDALYFGPLTFVELTMVNPTFLLSEPHGLLPPVQRPIPCPLLSPVEASCAAEQRPDRVDNFSIIWEISARKKCGLKPLRRWFFFQLTVESMEHQGSPSWRWAY